MTFDKSAEGLEAMQRAIGGWIEQVTPKRPVLDGSIDGNSFGPNSVFFCDEEGLLKALELNPAVSSILGRPVFGPVLILDRSEVW